MIVATLALTLAFGALPLASAEEPGVPDDAAASTKKAEDAAQAQEIEAAKKAKEAEAAKKARDAEAAEAARKADEAEAARQAEEAEAKEAQEAEQAEEAEAAKDEKSDAKTEPVRTPGSTAKPAKKPATGAGDPEPADDQPEASTLSLPAGLADIEPPYLRWRAVDESGRTIEDTTWQVKLPVEDEPTATVIDNTGQKNYRGADLDETPGVFLVTELLDDQDPEVSHVVVKKETYELNPIEADGFVVGVDGEGQDLEAAASADQKVQKLVLQPTVAARGAVDADDEPTSEEPAGEQARSEDLIEAQADSPMVPFGVVGPEPGTGRHLYWNLRNGGTTSSYPLTGGGTFELQFGGNSGSASWVNSPTYVVVDCVAANAAGCTGYDKDPDAGEFQVPDGASGPNGAIAIPSGVRPNWRVRPAAAPVPWQWDGKTWGYVSSTSTWSTGRFSSNNAESLSLTNFQAAPVGLTWDLRNGTAASSPLVGAGTFELQGPGGTGSTANWNSNPTIYTVVDCVSVPCTGYDSDPAPGAVQVLSGASGPNGTLTLANSQHWRVRPSGAAPQWTWNGNLWGPITSTSWLSTLTLRLPTSGLVYRDLGDLEAAAAFVTWDVPNSQATGSFVGGAAFDLRNFTRASSTTFTIPDCIAAPCTDYDSDPAPGRFKVANGATDANGANPIVMSSTDRMQYRQGTPSSWQVGSTTYGFTSPSTSWSPGSNYTWTNTNGVYSYNLGSVPAQEVQTQPSCAAGYVYGIQNSGQIRQVAPNGNVTDFGNAAPSGGNFNGLGIGTGGSPVFAYARSGTGNSDSNVSIYSYDVATGQWTDTGHNVDSTASSRTVTFVAGAVNLDTGRYFLGGYSGSGNDRVFRIWEYNPATNTSVYKGHIRATGDGASNGDIAFDSNGNLFVVRGAGSTTTIYSVTAANLAAANGSSTAIPSSGANPVSNTTSDVNGVAFDANGQGFLSSSGTVQKYDMPGWSGQAGVTTSLDGSNDLASCGSPPTITIEKFIEGGRVNSGDQFRLTLKQGATTIGEVTTTGGAVGLQNDRIGPIPTVRNVTLTFSESAAGGTNLNDYVSSYRCLVDGVQTVQGNGTSGTIVIPSGGQSVNCRFHNSPLIANVTIHKDVTDGAGNNPAPRSGWTVGMTSTATSGTVTTTPAGTPTQPTDASGNAAWSLKFNAYTGRATVDVSETMQPGYQFVSGECVITHLDGTTSSTTLAGPTATALTGIAPGDQVNCDYLNQPSPGALTVTKVFDGAVPGGDGIEFSGLYTCVLGGLTVASGTWAITGSGPATLTPDEGMPDADAIPAEARCSVTEDDLDDLDLPNVSWEWDTPTIGAAVTVPSGGTAGITVTNKVRRVHGNFSVTKVVPEGSTADPTNPYSGGWECVLDDEPAVTGTWEVTGEGTWTSTASNLIPLGATCSVTSETRPDAPTEDPANSWDGPPAFGEPVEARAGDEVLGVVTVTNRTKLTLGSVTWTKVDEGNTLLSGSEWELKGPGNAGPAVPVTDCVADSADDCEGPDTDPAAGRFLIDGLLWGDYWLTETKAPAGYVRDTTVRPFTIGADDPAQLAWDLGPVTNTKIPGVVIPLTGGLGRDAFSIVGLAILLLGFGAAAATRLRNRRKEVA